jgi:hypothetical protein
MTGDCRVDLSWLCYRGGRGVTGGRSHSDAPLGATVWSTTASSSAEYRVVAGEPELADRFTARSPIQRTEMGLDVHPVERAFDDLKEVIRTHRQRLLQTPNQ